MINKLLIIMLSLFISACATFPSSGPPFVKVNEGSPYATFNAPKKSSFNAWVFTVDNKTVARNILGESVSHSGDVYVSPGKRTVGVSCFSYGKYNRLNIILSVDAGEVYTFKCEAGKFNNAVYSVTDSSGKPVEFVTEKPYDAPKW